MKRFRVEKEDGSTMVITLFQPPYEDADVLSRTKWKLKDCTITEIKMKYDGEE